VAGVKFIDENGGPGVRLRKRHLKKGYGIWQKFFEWPNA